MDFKGLSDTWVKWVVLVLALLGLGLSVTQIASISPSLSKEVDRFPLHLTYLESNHYAYLWLMAGSLLFPFLLSFDRKVAFWQSWRWLFPAAALTGLFFYPLDMLYTHLGVWGFNPAYYRWSIGGLPDGEWLFFIVVPYCCIFIYECLNAYFPKNPFKSWVGWIDSILLGVLLLVGFVFHEHFYTSTKFLLSALLLLFNVFWLKSHYRAEFYRCFLVQLLPFLLVNGILTGGFTNEPIVLYNNAENLSPVIGRLASIPFDDLAYNFLLLLMVTNWYEWLRGKSR